VEVARDWGCHHLDGLVAASALESGISGGFALSDPSEEVFEGLVELPEGGSSDAVVDFPVIWEVLLDEGHLVLLVSIGDLLLAVPVGVPAVQQGGVLQGTAHIQDSVQALVSCL